MDKFKIIYKRLTNIFNATYLKLILLSVTFTVIFYFLCNIMVGYILDSNMKLVCDVYYDQISSKIKGDINLLISANQYLAGNEIILEYLTEDNKKEVDIEIKRERVLDEVNDIEKILSTISFVNTINIVDLENKYLFSRQNEAEGFDITKRPWYDKNLFIKNKEGYIITKKYIDYTTSKETISILSLIYNDNNNNKDEDIPIGMAILDIYVEDLLKYIDSSFHNGVLETDICTDNISVEDLGYDKDSYNVYLNKSILHNGESLIFKFNKSELTNAEATEKTIIKMRTILLFVGIGIAISLFAAIKISFNSALVSINKLKSILEKLNNNSDFVNNKNEFRQLEMLADALNKSFDDKIQELIYYDELTGLPNRKMLEHTCERLISQNKPFALIFIDLNKFKYINDVFGHIVGDEYLIVFSKKISSLIKDKGMITRYSGDEFIFIYENYVNEDELLEFYNQKVLKVFSNPIKINEELITEISFSAGVAIYPKNARTFEELINKSDFMMYFNKKNMVNRHIGFFDEKVYESLLYSEKIKDNLKTALENNEFYLNYQPIIDKNCNILKAEALIRWENKELGFISPDIFIKYLEETRQIIQVGYWIIEKVCEDIIRYNLQERKLQIAINISSLQIMLRDFVDNVVQIIDKYNINYENICFEITETVLLQNKQFVLENLDKLRKLGIKIALDDFGTGYSSFSYLRNYKLNILKIDKSFLKANDNLDFDIIDQIKELAHLLGMEVVIEGIETKEQFDRMSRINIDYLQGYYFSKPIALEELDKMLQCYNVNV